MLGRSYLFQGDARFLVFFQGQEILASTPQKPFPPKGDETNLQYFASVSWLRLKIYYSNQSDSVELCFSLTGLFTHIFE